MGLCRVGVDRGMESLSQAWHLPVFYWFSGIFHYFLIKKIQYITVKKKPRKSLKKGVNLSSNWKCTREHQETPELPGPLSGAWTLAKMASRSALALVLVTRSLGPPTSFPVFSQGASIMPGSHVMRLLRYSKSSRVSTCPDLYYLRINLWSLIL